MKIVNVIKADGTQEPYDRKKVLSSLLRAGYTQSQAEDVLAKTEARLYDNIQTWEIYEDIRNTLKEEKSPFAKTRYGLKQAIMMLGPTGYPFEDFIAKVLEAEGYQTQVRQMLTGKCVIHEIDVVAEKDGRKLMVEAKFHNNPGARSDLHVAMYTKARFDDIRTKNNIEHCMLITNTKLSTDAITYANCENYQVVGWNHPEDQSLRVVIEKHRLYPVTMLTSVSHAQKIRMLTDHIVLCKDLLENKKFIDTLNLSTSEKQNLINELNFLVAKG